MNDLTYKVRAEDILKILWRSMQTRYYIKTDAKPLFLTRLAKTSTEWGGGAGRKRSEGQSGPGKKDTANWDYGFAPKNY